MQLSKMKQLGPNEWQLPASGKMRVPGIIYADAELITGMDDKVFEQLSNVASLPGIVNAAYAMPDAHWGYGFPIGGVAAFDPDSGVVSAGGVGFDISCGVRNVLTGLSLEQINPHRQALADALFHAVPAGVGSEGTLSLDPAQMNAMLSGGARWAVEQGFGKPEDLQRIEESGCMEGARPDYVSDKAKRRQRRETGTLGSGNHYLEAQAVKEVFDPESARGLGVAINEVVVSIHCGSRGLGHQIGTEFLREMVYAAAQFGIDLPDRELACAPINSLLGQRYLGAVRAGINCALANRQIICHLLRQVFAGFFPDTELKLLFDVSHNTCKEENHDVDGQSRSLYVHRKGATRAFGPGHSSLPDSLKQYGQPVLIGGSMGSSSYILTGSRQSEKRAFSSACHGAGRAMSRHQASRRWRGRQLLDDLAGRGILIRSPSLRGVAEEAPGAYKDVDSIVRTAERAGLAKMVARLEPLLCIKG